MKIGVFGGTFNPVHLGHIEAAKLILAGLSLDRVIFVPVKDPVHKKLDGNASPYDRLAMLELAIVGMPFFSADSIEIDRDRPSYTVYTLAAYKERYPESTLYLILGSDSFNAIDTWFDYIKIIELAMLVVAVRPGDEELRFDLIHRFPFIQPNVNFVDISSSLVRQRLRDGSGIDGLVPEAVAHYIKDKGLYLQ